MSHFSIHGVVCGAMLLLGVARSADAQDPQTRSRTGVVQGVTPDSAATPDVTGHTRELVCRGKPGIDLRVQQDPSPRDPRLVAMVLRYDRVKEMRTFSRSEMGLVDNGLSIQFIPGSCTWGHVHFPDIPLEPGVVYFDLPRDGQTHASAAGRDTSVAAAAEYPDVVSMPRYLSDSDRYWVFYVDDVSNVSISFRASLRGGGVPDPPGISGIARSVREASPGSATPSSPHVLPAAAAPSVSVAGPADSTARRTATVRTPTPRGPTTGVRDAAPATATVSTARTPSTTVTTKSPAGANTPARQVPERRIRDVQAIPGPRGVRISFWAKIDGLANREQRVWSKISSDRPAWNAGERQWVFPDWAAFMSTHLRTLSDGRFEIQPTARLEPGRRYYYLIEVHASEPTLPNVQHTGSFIAEFGQ